MAINREIRVTAPLIDGIKQLLCLAKSEYEFCDT